MLRTFKIAAAASIGLLMIACDSAVLVAPTGPNGNMAAQTMPVNETDAADETASTDTTTPADDPVDLISTAEAAGNFTTLLSALESAGLRDTLADPENQFTVFAPTDAAFELLGMEAVDDLLANTDALNSTLLYHVIDGSNDAAAIISNPGSTITTLNGQDIAVTLDRDQLRINTATITTADVAASNGFIHVIDAVLTPPGGAADPATEATENITQLLSNDPQFSTLVSVITEAGLDTTLAGEGAFTLFAPTDNAFNDFGPEMLLVLQSDTDLLRDALLFHVVEGTAINSVAATAAAGTTITSASGQPLRISLDGSNLNVNDATVVQADIAATNGVIHAIDGVLTATPGAAAGTIVNVLSNNPDYSTLANLITQAGLVDNLNDVDASFTLFAPNNAAIAAATELTTGFMNDPAALANLLLGHVHSAALTADQVLSLDGENLEMAVGTQPITVDDGTISIGDATVVDPDLLAQNGVIHGIDAVILP